MSQVPHPMTQATLSRYRAERLLRRDFDRLRSRVLAAVRARLRTTGLKLDRSDLDACYATAWHGLYGAVLQGREIEDPVAWLVLVTFRRAIDEGRVRSRQAPRRDGLAAAAVADPDFAGALDDRARLNHLFEALRGRLSARERQAVTLCYLQGLTRSQAAARMGISDARMRKLMDGARGRPGVASKFAQLAEAVGAGEWCEQQDSLVRAYAFGLLDPDGERHRLAAAHLHECPPCRARVACLRGLAGVLAPISSLSAALRLALGRHARSLGARATGRAAAVKPAVAGLSAAVIGAGAAALIGGALVGRPSAAPVATQAAVSSPSWEGPAQPLRSVRAGHRQGSRRAVPLARGPSLPGMRAFSATRAAHRSHLATSIHAAGPSHSAAPSPSAIPSRTAGSRGMVGPRRMVDSRPAAGEFTPERVRRAGRLGRGF